MKFSMNYEAFGLGLLDDFSYCKIFQNGKNSKIQIFEEIAVCV